MRSTAFRTAAGVFLLLSIASSAAAAEGDALSVEAIIRARHVPFGAILDPIFTLTDSDQVANYTRCGDSALWTGHYLAAESFRYQVTHSAEALSNVQSAINALKGLTDVTGTNLLARCMVPMNSSYAPSIISQESGNGIHINASAGWIWVGNTSRDEYAGALFGLAVAYDMVLDAAIRSSISDLVTRLVDALNGNNWSVVMPDGSSSTSFLVRPDQIETFLAIGRRVNFEHFSSLSYETQRTLLAPGVPVPVGVDVSGDDSYFKFNLDYINLYNLIRLEASSAKSIYQTAYGQLRSHTETHQNAFFNVIDLALNGPNAARDSETLALLDAWLLRLRRDFGSNLTGTVPVCGTQACQPVPVWLRPNTDFLWQRSPFTLMLNGGAGIIETAGIDYILPYWMARYYGLRESTVVTSAAAAVGVVAPGSLATIYGTSLSAVTDKAQALPLPLQLGGITVTVQDTAGNSATAPLLYVSPSQINFLMPENMATGIAAFTISGSGTTVHAIGAIGQVAPAIFSIDGSGTGFASATALRSNGGNPATLTPFAIFDCRTACQALPITLGSNPVFLTLYATGIRHHGPDPIHSVLVTVHGVSVPVLFAGTQPDFAGLDQINVQLPPELAGSGISDIEVKVDQHRANPVTVSIQ
jgi:uncharacterized protein (TIGR03437 family)